MTSTETEPLDLSALVMEAFSEESRSAFSLMGPNGAGKSITLNKIWTDLWNKRIPAVMLPANRNMAAPPVAALTARIASVLNPLPFLLLNPTKHPRDSYAERLEVNQATEWALASIVKRSEQIDNEYQEALVRFHRGGKQGVEPVEPENPALFFEQRLTRIFGYETTIIRHSHGSGLRFQRGSKSFGADKLSDGEKQVLLLSALLAASDLTRFVFLVDEPELHLNDAKAIEVWEAMEGSFPNAVYVYATHSVAFATRPTIQSKFLIGSDGKFEKLSNDTPLDSSIIRSMVGARSQVMRTHKPIIFCEDDLSRLVLSDIFKNDGFEIIHVDGKKNVIAALDRKATGGWDKIYSSDHPACGVIDRDTRDAEDMASLENHDVICLPIFEAESILLAPEIATWAMSISKGAPVGRDEYVAILIEAARNALQTTLELVREYSRSRTQPSLTFRLDSSGAALKEVKVAPPHNDLEKIFRDQAANILTILANGDASGIVQVFSGEKLYRTFAPLTKRICGNPWGSDAAVKYNEVRALSGFSEILATLPWLEDFRTKVLTRLEARTA